MPVFVIDLHYTWAPQHLNYKAGDVELHMQPSLINNPKIRYPGVHHFYQNLAPVGGNFRLEEHFSKISRFNAFF